MMRLSERASTVGPIPAPIRRVGLLALGLLLQADAPPGAAQPGPDEVTVTHARLTRLRLELGVDDIGLYACRVTVGSGDPLVDGFACPAARLCVPLQPRTYARLLACIDDRIVAMVVKHDGYAVRR